MLYFYCFYDYKNVDSIIASWVLKRKFNDVNFYPYSEEEKVPYVYVSNDYEKNIFIFIGTNKFPFKTLKEYNLGAKKFYIFNNNKIYINKYKQFKDILNTELREIINTEKSLTKMVWEYVFPDVKIPKFVEIMNEYFVKKENNAYICTVGTIFGNKINYIQDMKEIYLRRNINETIGLKIKK